ncbi:hypothetical protein C0992_011498 [Termitomyces sp. T32_za158]|nr:hypothetical protein C0992_011498 [Termitomyces sp. T32_za158]
MASESNHFEHLWTMLPQGSDDDIDENTSTDILKYGVQQPPDCQPPYQFVDVGTLEGRWVGYPISDVSWLVWYICLDIEKSTRSEFSGKALFSDRADPLDLQGSFICEQGTTCGTELSLEFGSLNFSGTLNETGTKITCGDVVCFTRTPAHLVQFRYAESDFEKDRSRARWNFASAAVLHEVRRQRFSKDFVITRLRENRRLKELLIKKSIYTLTRDHHKTYKEQRSLEPTISPQVRQFFYAIAQYIIERLPHR